jgi:hypothetical protein
VAVIGLMGTQRAFQAAMWPTGIIVALIGFLVTGAVHMGYARIRYKLSETYFRKEANEL